MDRLPPHSLEAEEAILGSLLIDPDAIFDVATFLRPDAFYSAQNQTIYEAIISLTDRHEPLDLITLTEELRRREQLEKVGGEAYIISLINAVPTAINAVSYGRVVEAASLRRKLIGAASAIANLAYDEAEDVNIVIDRSEQALFSISEQRTTRDLVPVKQIAREYLERIEKLHERGEDIIGVPTGFTDLDRLLGGLNKSDLLILAARPGMGKCVTADTRLVDPQTGALTTIETLVQRQQANLLTLDHNDKLRPSQASHFIDNGIKPVYRVTTRQGREIKTTLSHPFLTINGWQPLYNLAVGDRVATPRIIPVFGQNDAPDYEVKTLAYLLADGSLVGRTPQFTNSNPRLREDFTQAALHFPGNKARVDDFNGRRTTTVYISQDATFFPLERTIPSPANFNAICRVLAINENELLPTGLAYSSQIKNTLTDWLEKIGVWGKTAAEKDVPAPVFEYTRPKLALFLNRLFACDGSIYVQGKSQSVVSYSTISKGLAHSVQHLLLRFGILSKLRSHQMKYQDNYRPAYEIRVTDAASVLTFVTEIGALGKEESLACVKECCLKVGHNSNVDTIPFEVWQQIAQAKGEQSWATVYRQLGFPPAHNLHVGKRAPSRARLLAPAEVLHDESLCHLAESDLFWDEIVSIEFVGEQQVYDLTVPDTHNFVADDMIVHNTALQTGIALTAALRYGKRVAMFNLEMSGEQLVQRMIAAETRIDSQRLRRGKLEEHEWPIFMEAIGRLSETRIFIDDTPSITANQLRTKCRRLYAEHGLDLIVIDYLQLMQAERSTNNRVQEISEISRSLKGLARELDVPVLAAAQLSRAVEQRSEKRPLLSDLRDSGSIEQDADVVMFIYRDEYYNPDTTERPNIAEINIAKHRNGPIGSIDLYWHGKLATFRNLQRQEINL
ncbi:MAG: replicative DNA helicase [Ardenticatenaceae bacterium]|nr:replicative DNA helicase [Ardenticatenaceae bacterium]